jgi:hypothetical protein
MRHWAHLTIPALNDESPLQKEVGDSLELGGDKSA